jgi:CheY-like chemotaxis protein
MFRVLLVDDNAATLSAYGVVLRHAGYETAAAQSAAACISQLSTDARRDACLLDLNLGDGTGLDVLRWMRRANVNVPTAVMTAFSRSFNPDEAIALGAMAYVDQPVEIEQLIDLVRQLVSPPSEFDRLESLHARVLTGQLSAIECVAASLPRELPPRLRRVFPHVPSELIIDATEDAILEYAANPARFDPLRHISLKDFIGFAARRNLASTVLAESRRKRREARYAAVQPIITPVTDSEPVQFDLWACLLSVITDPVELRAAKRWLDGDRSTDALAEALGIDDLSQADRRREVKRFKDRLLKRISRHLHLPPSRNPSAHG